MRDTAGNIFGTTWAGGSRNFGTVYKVGPSGQDIVVLYTFQGGSDGANPTGFLIEDSAGNVYGTTAGGGNQCPPHGLGCGTVFKLDEASGETVLYRFTGGTDGAYPSSGVIRDSAGNLYGTTSGGGTAAYGSGYGVVYMVDNSGRETTLYGFTATDGAYHVGVIRDPVGNLYGTSEICCSGPGSGVLYRVNDIGQETVVHDFTGRNGLNPKGGLIRDSAGNLYGTTQAGGSGWGVVYKVDKAGRETVLYSFTGGTDGGSPAAGLVRDSAGNLYGTTIYGGIYAGYDGNGVVFKLDTTGHETVLYAFTGGADGGTPSSGLTLDATGNLYGTTLYGGLKARGVLFRLTPQ
jgi:uncharacterized repeat protein (TIGR03803 family)